MARTIFHGPKGVRAIEVRLYKFCVHCSQGTFLLESIYLHLLQLRSVPLARTHTHACTHAHHYYLREFDGHVGFSAIFNKEIICNFLFAFMFPKRFLERFYSKRKEFAFLGVTFFPLRVNPSQKRFWLNPFMPVASHKRAMANCVDPDQTPQNSRMRRLIKVLHLGISIKHTYYRN